jgi:hypothetical protein
MAGVVPSGREERTAALIAGRRGKRSCLPKRALTRFREAAAEVVGPQGLAEVARAVLNS